MAEGKRPGGLTALAVLNFVFAGLGLIVFLGLFALLAAVDHAAHNLDDKAQVSAGVVYLLLLFGVIRMGLMIASGVGYLGQKKFMGRTLGNSYAVFALLDTVIGLGLAHQGFGIGAIIGMIYPVLTLYLLNTTFKDDLVN